PRRCRGCAVATRRRHVLDRRDHRGAACRRPVGGRPGRPARAVKRASQAASVASLVAVATALAAAAVKMRQAAGESPLTNGFSRTVRVWRLSSRNAARFAAMKVRRVASPADRRAELDEQFAIRTAEDVAKHLGEMKGVLMKAGQLVSFI